MVRERDGFRYALNGSCWHREELGILCDLYGRHVWLSLVHPELEVGSIIEKLLLIDNALTLLDNYCRACGFVPRTGCWRGCGPEFCCNRLSDHCLFVHSVP